MNENEMAEKKHGKVNDFVRDELRKRRIVIKRNYKIRSGYLAAYKT
jgi:hypothetical protein